MKLLQVSYIQLLKKLLFPLLGIIFTVSFYVNIQELDPIASSYPKGIIAFLAVLFVWTLVVELKSIVNEKRDQETDTESKQPVSFLQLIREWKKPLLTLFVLFIYANLISHLGFYVSTFCFLLTLFFVLGLRNIKIILFNLILIMVLSYTLFDYFLQIQLPKGIFL